MVDLKILEITQNSNFQTTALTEALELISKNTGITFESLVNQFPTNDQLQRACAKIIVQTAMKLKESL